MSRTGKMLCAVVSLVVCVGVIPRLTAPSRGQAPPQGQAKPKSPASSAPATDSKKPAPLQSAAPVKPSDTSAEDAILQKLQESAEFSFKSVPLKEAMEFLAKKHKLSIVINRSALAAASVAEDVAVTQTVKELPLEWALNRLLRPHNLAWLVRNEVLDITSNEDADTFLATRVYPVADLVLPKRAAGADPDTPPNPDYESLIELMTSVVRPASWKEAGGAGTIEPAALTLVISQTQAIHRDVAALLAALRDGAKLADAKRPPRPAVIRCYDGRAEERIGEILRRRTSFAFNESSLAEMAEVWSKEHGLETAFDAVALKEADVDASRTAFGLQAKEMSLRSGIELILRDHKLSWIVRDGALVITSREHARSSALAIHVYPVADLTLSDRDKRVLPNNRPLLPPDPFWELKETITNSVLPDSWKEAGGPGSLASCENAASLVVWQTREVHESIERLLADLRERGTVPKRSPTTAAPTAPARPQLRDDEIILRAYGIPADVALRPKVAEQAAALIQELIAADTWKAKDTQAFLRVWPDRLVIRQTAKVHREIQKLLQDLDLLSPPVSGPPPAPPPKDE